MLLITGGAGYIGSHTVINLLNAGKEIVIFDNLENGHLETVETLQSLGDVKFEKGDLRNIEEIESVFSKYKIDAVIHFAAFALVGESVENPAKYYRNNTSGTLNLLDTMIKHNCKKIVFSSTCATYGNPEYIPVDENHPQKPVSPYGSSKLMVEKIMEDYDKAYGLKSIRLRYFNVAGCDAECRVGEWHEPETHLVPNILKSVFEKGQTFKIFGDDYNTPDGTCIRDYVNVEDLAEAHRLALEYLERENKSDVFNLGTECGNSVKEIFDTCERVLGQKIAVEVVPRRAGDAEALYANAQKAKTILGWQPKRTIEDSIKTAYKWEEKRIKEITMETFFTWIINHETHQYSLIGALSPEQELVIDQIINSINQGGGSVARQTFDRNISINTQLNSFNDITEGYTFVPANEVISGRRFIDL